MDWSAILETVWEILNTPAAIAAAALVFAYGLKRLYAWRPAWAAYEGTIIAAVKHAEKAIPDDTESAGMRRFDEALRYVLEIYAAREGKQATRETKAELAEGISLMHEKLERDGTLNRAA